MLSLFNVMKTRWPATVLFLLGGILATIAWVAFAGPKVKPSVDDSELKQSQLDQTRAPSSNFSDRFTAIEQLLARRDVSSALKLLRDLEAAGDSSPRIQILLANCFRHFRNAKKIDISLERARRNGATEQSIRLIQALTQTQAGMMEGDLTRQMQRLIDEGATTQDAVHSVVLGCLYRRDFERVDTFLSEQESKPAEADDALAMRGMFWQAKGDFARAESFLELAVQSNPRNELAHIALLDNFESPSGSLTKSLQKVRELGSEFPSNPQTSIRYSRILRKLGLDAEAKVVLDNLPYDDAMQEIQTLEQTELAVDQGRYQDAQILLAMIGLTSADDYRRMINQGYQFLLDRRPSNGEPLFQRAYLGAIAFALGGKQSEADDVMSDILDRVARIRRLNDLTNIQTVSNNRQAVEAERTKLTSLDSAERAQRSNSAVNGEKIFLDKCAHCHGANEAGDGRAARHLFPMPRNLVNHRFRYVSAINGVATDEDLTKVIRLGLPGTSMPSFPDMSESDFRLLIPLLRGFQRQGWEVRLREPSKSKLELTEMVSIRTTPTEPLAFPDPPENREQAMRRGGLLFEASGCIHCHGNPTKTDADHPIWRLFDESGQPILSRNFATEPFKGGSSLRDIYCRLALGIPGTPHPSLSASPTEIMDLACFIESVASGLKQPTTNYIRRSRLHSFNPEP